MAVSSPSLLHYRAHKKVFITILLGQVTDDGSQSYWGQKLVIDIILPEVKEYWNDVVYDHFSSNGFFSSVSV